MLLWLISRAATARRVCWNLAPPPCGGVTSPPHPLKLICKNISRRNICRHVKLRPQGHVPVHGFRLSGPSIFKTNYFKY